LLVVKVPFFHFSIIVGPFQCFAWNYQPASASKADGAYPRIPPSFSRPPLVSEMFIWHKVLDPVQSLSLYALTSGLTAFLPLQSPPPFWPISSCKRAGALLGATRFPRVHSPGHFGSPTCHSSFNSGGQRAFLLLPLLSSIHFPEQFHPFLGILRRWNLPRNSGFSFSPSSCFFCSPNTFFSSRFLFTFFF